MEILEVNIENTPQNENEVKENKNINEDQTMIEYENTKYYFEEF